MAEKQVKECSVVVVKLLDDIVIKGTVKVYKLQHDESNKHSDSEAVLPPTTGTTSESLRRLQKCLDKIPLESPPKKHDTTKHKISVYTKVNKNDVITEVKCKRFRKRKLDSEQDSSDVETAVQSVVSYLVEKVVSSTTSASDINYASPGTQEVELVKGFCKENGFASEDYDDLKGLFTFRTLPLEKEDHISSLGQRRSKKRKEWREPLRKILRQRYVDNENKAFTPSFDEDLRDAIQNESPQEATTYPTGLERIENEKIRKILEDFGRLSRNQESLNNKEQKKNLMKAKEEKPKAAQNRNSITVKPLNLSKKDAIDAEQKIHAQTDQPSEKVDLSSSGSILMNLLYSETSGKKRAVAKDSETQTDHIVQVASVIEKCQQSVAKKTKSQQTDQEGEDHFLEVHNSDYEMKTGGENVSTQSEAQSMNAKWINDPNAILSKIHKLKRDIIYLELLAEEKEKERIAILCFKSYKESILRKIYTNEAANKESISAFQKECNASAVQSNESNHPIAPLFIPELINTVKMPIRNGKAPSSNVTLPAPLVSSARSLHPSTLPFLQTLRPQPSAHSPYNKNIFGVETKDDNIDPQFGNCLDCDLSKASSLHSSSRNHSISLSQDRTRPQNSKEYPETLCQDPPLS